MLVRKSIWQYRKEDENWQNHNGDCCNRCGERQTHYNMVNNWNMMDTIFFLIQNVFTEDYKLLDFMPSAQKCNEKYMVSCLTEPLIQGEAQTHNSKEKALRAVLHCISEED